MSGTHLVEVPGASVVLLVGPAGAGKSTLARRHFPPDAVISSDSLRATVTGDVADQTANARVFGAVHRALEARLAAGRLAVIDATNLTAGGRRAIRIRAARAGAPTIAVVVAPPPDVVHRQNAARPGRVVPEAVVARHLAALDRLLARAGLEGEGYARIVVLRDPAEIAAIEFRIVG